MVNVKYKFIHNDAVYPHYEHHGDAGFDLRSARWEDTTILPGETALIETGIAFGIPPGHFIMLAPKSGLAKKYNLTLQNSPAIIDSTYVGEVKVLLRNEGNSPYVVKPGRKICQAIVMEFPKVKFWETTQLKQTSRGSNGFGSTGE